MEHQKKRCEECGDIGYIHPNGAFVCPNMACINFPYVTSQNLKKMMERWWPDMEQEIKPTNASPSGNTP